MTVPREGVATTELIRNKIEVDHHKAETSLTVLMNEGVWVVMVGVAVAQEMLRDRRQKTVTFFIFLINLNLNDSIKSWNYTVNLALVIGASILSV